MLRNLGYGGAVLCVTAVLTSVLVCLESLGGEPPESVAEVIADGLETLFLVLAMFASALLVARLRTVEQESRQMRLDVADAAAAGQEWRMRSQRLLAGLAEAIDAQFSEWGLTAAEADVAGLMLKGLSLKQIAESRRTSEATTRQQAQSIYRKSGLSNRAELAAFFLEDVFDAGAEAVAARTAAGNPPADRPSADG